MSTLEFVIILSACTAVVAGVMYLAIQVFSSGTRTSSSIQVARYILERKEVRLTWSGEYLSVDVELTKNETLIYSSFIPPLPMRWLIKMLSNSAEHVDSHVVSQI